MELPALSAEKVDLVIPEARLREELGLFSLVRAQSLAKLYLSIGGRRSLRWADDTPLARISQKIESEVEGKAKSRLKAGGKSKKSVTLGFMPFVAWSDRGPRLLVAVELPYYYVLCTAWFDHLKKKGGKVYEFFETILAKIIQEFPNYSVPHYFETVIDNYDTESLDAEFGESMTEAYNGIKAIQNTYGRKTHSVAAIERRLRRVGKNLSRRQRQWARLAIRTMEEMDRAFTKETPWLHEGVPEEFTDRPTPERFFLIVSRPGEYAEHAITEDVNMMAGESGPPVMFLHVQSKKDLRCAARVLSFYRLLQELFYTAETIFGSVYFRKERRNSEGVNEQHGKEESERTGGV
jgi:hypothetical protein